MADLQAKLELFADVLARRDIKPAAKNVFGCLLLSHHNTLTGRCNPGYARLIERTGLSRDAIVKAIQLLRSKGIVDYESCGGGSQTNTNSYRFPGLDGYEKKTGQENRPVRNSDHTGIQNRSEGYEKKTGGVRKTDPRGTYFGPKPRNNQELNQEKNTAPPAPLAANDVWAGFFSEVVLVFRAAGHEAPREQGRIETWRSLGYKPEVCLAVIRDAVSRKRIRALSWFDKPMIEVHTGIPRRAVGSMPGEAPSFRIYEGDPEVAIWTEYEGRQGIVFTMVLRDHQRGKKYAVRSTRLPPGAVTPAFEAAE